MKRLLNAICIAALAGTLFAKSNESTDFEWFPENPIQTSNTVNPDYRSTSIDGLFGLEKIQPHITLGNTLPIIQKYNVPRNTPNVIISHTFIAGGLFDILPYEGISKERIHANLKFQYLFGTEGWTGKWIDEAFFSFGHMIEGSASDFENISDLIDISTVINNLMINAYFIDREDNYVFQLGVEYNQPIVSKDRKSPHVGMSLFLEVYLSNPENLSFFISAYHRQGEQEIPENYLDRFRQYSTGFKGGIEYDVGPLEFMLNVGADVYKFGEINNPDVKLLTEVNTGISISFSPIGLN